MIEREPSPENHLNTFLHSMGPPLSTLSTETVGRVVRMLEEFFTPSLYGLLDPTTPGFTVKTFPAEGQHDMQVVCNIEFFSVCEHHLLPFYGKVHVGYLPAERIMGLSKIPRIVDWVARRPQLQERMTSQIAETLKEHLQPKGIGVIVRGKHLCVGMRGIKKPDAVFVTSALRGVFLASPDIRDEFYTMVGLNALGGPS